MHAPGQRPRAPDLGRPCGSGFHTEFCGDIRRDADAPFVRLEGPAVAFPAERKPHFHVEGMRFGDHLLAAQQFAGGFERNPVDLTVQTREQDLDFDGVRRHRLPVTAHPDPELRRHPGLVNRQLQRYLAIGQQPPAVRALLGLLVAGFLVIVMRSVCFR